jgi:ABC-type sugar transport system ATPase subunit
MSLLAFEHVGKHVGSGRSSWIGQHERVVLSDLTFELCEGELMAIWGRRGSGRSTLLRLAAGLEAPSSGVVRFAGQDLAGRGGEALGEGIGFCRPGLRGGDGNAISEELMIGQLARGVSLKTARARTFAALERAGAQGCAPCRADDLDTGESVRVAIARALTLEPRLLVIDEPTKGVDPIERDEILQLLRSLADDGLAILTCIGETTAFAGSDRALSLSEGELRGRLAPELAPVIPLRARTGA